MENDLKYIGIGGEGIIIISVPVEIDLKYIGIGGEGIINISVSVEKLSKFRYR